MTNIFEERSPKPFIANGALSLFAAGLAAIIGYPILLVFSRELNIESSAWFVLFAVMLQVVIIGFVITGVVFIVMGLIRFAQMKPGQDHRHPSTDPASDPDAGKVWELREGR